MSSVSRGPYLLTFEMSGQLNGFVRFWGIAVYQQIPCSLAFLYARKKCGLDWKSFGRCKIATSPLKK